MGLACEQTLRSALAAGREKEELATTSLDLNSASNSHMAPHRLSCQISVNQRECKQTLENT